MTDLSTYYDESYPPSLWTDPPPPPVPPTLTALVPATSVVGVPVTVSVQGTGFTASSIIKADGNPLPTTFVSAVELTVSATPLTAGTAQITVTEGALTSNALPYVVTAVELAGALTAKVRKQHADEAVEWSLTDDYQPEGADGDD